MDFAFSTTSNTNIRFASREAGTNRPELVIVTSGSATNTPTPTNPCTETGITYSNAPVMGTQLGSSGTFGAGWTTVDVTSYITGNGTYNFAFSTTSNTNITLRLRREKLRLRSLHFPRYNDKDLDTQLRFGVP